MLEWIVGLVFFVILFGWLAVLSKLERDKITRLARDCSREELVEQWSRLRTRLAIGVIKQREFKAEVRVLEQAIARIDAAAAQRQVKVPAANEETR